MAIVPFWFSMEHCQWYFWLRWYNISSLGRQDFVTQFLVKITFLYKLVAKKLDFALSKLQISIWKYRATVAWYIEGCPIHNSVKAAMFFGSPEHLTFLRYEVLSPQRRYGTASSKYTDSLQTLQNRASKIILGVNPYSHTPVRELHARLGWKSLETRRCCHLNTMVFKALNELAPPYLKECFQFCQKN